MACKYLVVTQDIVENLLRAVAEPLRELDVELDDEVALLARLLGEWEAEALQPLRRARPHDLVPEVDVALAVEEGGDADRGAAERVPQRHLGCVDKVGAVARERRVRLVPDDEGDVGGDLAGHLVALLGERHPRARLPALLDVEGEHLVLLPEAARRLIVHPPRDLHPLLGAARNVLQADLQLLLDGRVLRGLGAAGGVERLRPVGREPSPDAAGAAAAAAAPDPAQEVLQVDVHALDAAGATGAADAAHRRPEERLEGVVGAEELLEGGARVAVVRVGEPAGHLRGGEPFGEAGAAAARAAQAALEALLADLVVDAALLGVGEDVVGLADLLELLLGAGVLVLVGVILEGKLPVRLLELVVVGGARQEQGP